jgi:putative ABC transport system permease protein
LLIATMLVEVIQSSFNGLVGKELSLFGASGAVMTGGIILLLVVTSLLAGSYPAWFISRFPPLFSLRGTMLSVKGRAAFRNVLVVFQFLVSIILIILTLAVYRQMRYMNSRPLGYNRENVAVIPLVGEDAMTSYQAVKDAFSKLPSVISSGASSEIPGNGFTMNGYLPEGFKEPIMINVLDIDADYLDNMNIPIVQGRGFDKASNTDISAFIINESLAKKLGWDDPVGKTIYREVPHKIIGVVSDFHFASLHQELQPLILTKEPWKGYNFLSVRIQPGSKDESVRNLTTAWNEVLPDEPFDLFFQEDYVKNSYSGVKNAGIAILWFAFLAIFIAGLGLLGLANYTFNLRKKEIGIRKVLGAETNMIARKVTIEFLRLVAIAGIIALPLAWWFLDMWLRNFAYKSIISPVIFILPIIFIIILAWLTIYLQVKKLANTNPVDVLKFE